MPSLIDAHLQNSILQTMRKENCKVVELPHIENDYRLMLLIETEKNQIITFICFLEKYHELGKQKPQKILF